MRFTNNDHNYRRRLTRAKNKNDQAQKKRKHGGSVTGRAPNCKIGREAAGKRLKQCYFHNAIEINEDAGQRGSLFTEAEFERRFRLPRNVYERVRKGVLEVDPFFREGRDCVGYASSTTDQKIVAAMRQMSLGVPVDGLVEIMRISESLILESRRRFTTVIIAKFELEFLRRPLAEDARDILQRHAKLGFPGSFGSLDCSG